MLGGMCGCWGTCTVVGVWLQGACGVAQGMCVVVGGVHGCGGCVWLRGDVRG